MVGKILLDPYKISLKMREHTNLRLWIEVILMMMNKDGEDDND